MTIHKEGYRMLTLLAIAVIAITFGVIRFFPELKWLHMMVGVGGGIIFLIFLQFFRSPKRNLVISSRSIVCPADGKVVAIEEVEEPEYFNGEKRIQVSVFMSPLNVHLNRYPISGRIAYSKYHPGKFLVAWHPKSSTENERNTVVVETEFGVSVLIRQIAGFVARRIVWYCHEDDRVKQGDELGFIKFGSRVDLFLPLDAKIKVEIDEKVQGGISILAEI
ncbi:MAG: phosphatidylserine decarboxylase family protein [Flavobacteriales bacterium]|nr:phosphatidylserine decarboxylase family protein [Flavobacteriales bacterium]